MLGKKKVEFKIFHVPTGALSECADTFKTSRTAQPDLHFDPPPFQLQVVDEQQERSRSL